MKKLLINLTLVLFNISAFSQDFLWAKKIGGISYDECRSLAVDGSGNVYITGGYSGQVDFDPGTGTSYLMSAGAGDIFITKLDASGNFVWAKSLGGETDDFAYSIAVDGSGNVYTTGAYNGTSDFDPGTESFNLTSTGGYAVFISKLDASGNFVWAKSVGGIYDDYGYSLALDVNNNVFITGSFKVTADFDPGTSSSTLTSAGSSDVFILKLSNSGNFVWAKKMGGSSDDISRSITIDGSGNVYTTGSFATTADFDPGTATSNLISAGGGDIFVSKLDASGNFGWAKSLGGTSADEGNSIAVDGSGNVYTTGSFKGTADFDPGTETLNFTSAASFDVFISKLNSSGNFVWAKSLGGNGGDIGYAIAVDGSGNVYTGGSFSGTADFDPGTLTQNITAAGASDIFISKLDASGNYVWKKSLGGAGDDFCSSLELDAAGNTHTSGYFGGTADFDPGSPSFNLTSGGLRDVFISKLKNIPVGIKYISNQKLLSVFPNPAIDQVIIKVEANLLGTDYTIFDQTGRKIINGNLDYSITTIDINQLARGFYFLQIGEFKTETLKVIKQ